MVKVGLLVFGVGVMLGVRSLMGRLTEPGDAPERHDFASEQEHMWATTGWRVALGLLGIGAVLVIIGLLS